MFGVLVPPSLRQSQQSFNEALQQVIQVLNLRQQVQTVGDDIEADEPNQTTRDEENNCERDILAQSEKTPLEKAPVQASGASETTGQVDPSKDST
uniref:Vacuolar ATPase assembly protein VMA22 n=1 Tax=Blastobotrys adeninivorans TaxID=409370 RepID=A0A060T1F4_BLAAD